MPVRVLVTSGTVDGCTKTCELIEGIEADCLIADRGYDSDEIVLPASAAGMYDTYLYQIRHPMENAFLKLKR